MRENKQFANFGITQKLLFMPGLSKFRSLPIRLLLARIADALHPKEKKTRPAKFQPSSSRRQIAKDVMQNTAMTQVFDFNFGIDSAAKHDFP